MARMYRWSLKTGWSWSPGACKVRWAAAWVLQALPSEILPVFPFSLGRKPRIFSSVWTSKRQNLGRAQAEFLIKRTGDPKSVCRKSFLNSLCVFTAV